MPEALSDKRLQSVRDWLKRSETDALYALCPSGVRELLAEIDRLRALPLVAGGEPLRKSDGTEKDNDCPNCQGSYRYEVSCECVCAPTQPVEPVAMRCHVCDGSLTVGDRPASIEHDGEILCARCQPVAWRIWWRVAGGTKRDVSELTGDPERVKAALENPETPRIDSLGVINTSQLPQLGRTE